MASRSRGHLQVRHGRRVRQHGTDSYTIGYIHVEQETQCMETRVKYETNNRYKYIQLCITECIEAMYHYI